MTKTAVDHSVVGDEEYKKPLKKQKWSDRFGLIPPNEGNSAFIGTIPIEDTDDAEVMLDRVYSSGVRTSGDIVGKDGKKKRGRPPKKQDEEVDVSDIESDIDEIFDSDENLF
jgi:hypothetical protein